MYKLQGVHLVGVSQPHEVHINWHPQGISLELSQANLENLKRSYEAQLTSLRKELEEKHQMEPQSAQPPSSPPQNPDGEADQTLQSETSNESEVFEVQLTIPDFESKFPERLDALCDALDEEEKKVLLKLRPELCEAHVEDINEWTKTYQAELQLHIEALRLTITETYNNQLKLLQEQLNSERDTALRCQYDELTSAYHENLEVLQHELEELEQRAGLTHDEIETKVRAEIQESYQSEIQQLEEQLDVVTHEKQELYAELSELTQSHMRQSSMGDVGSDVEYHSDLSMRSNMETRSDRGLMSDVEYRSDEEVRSDIQSRNDVDVGSDTECRSDNEIQSDVETKSDTDGRSDTEVRSDLDDGNAADSTSNNHTRSGMHNKSDTESMQRMNNGSKNKGDAEGQSDLGAVLHSEESQKFNHSSLFSPCELDSEAGTGTFDHSQNLITELQQEIETYKAEMESFKVQMESKHQTEIEELQCKHVEELKEIREKHEKQIRERMTKTEDVLMQQLREMESRIEKTKEEHFAEVEELQTKLSEYEHQLRDLEACKDMEELTTRLNVTSLEEEIDRLIEELNEKEDELAKVNEKLAKTRSLDEELDKLTEALTARDREIVGLRKKVSQSLNLADEVEKLIEEITERDNEIAELKKAIDEKSMSFEELKKLHLAVGQKDDEILSLQEKIEDLHDAIKYRDEEMKKMKLKLAQTVTMDAEIDRLSELVSAKEKEIAMLKSSVCDPDHISGESGEMTEMMLKHQTHIDDLMAEMSAQHLKEIKTLQNKIKDHETQSGIDGRGELSSADLMTSSPADRDKQTCAKQLADLQEKHSIELKELNLRWEKIISEKDTEFEQRIEAELEKVWIEIRNMTQKLLSGVNPADEKALEGNEKELYELLKGFQEQIAGSSEQRSLSELVELRKENAEFRNQLKEDMLMVEENEKLIEQTKEEHDKMMTSQRLEFEMKIKDLENKLVKLEGRMADGLLLDTKMKGDNGSEISSEESKEVGSTGDKTSEGDNSVMSSNGDSDEVTSEGDGDGKMSVTEMAALIEELTSEKKNYEKKITNQEYKLQELKQIVDNLEHERQEQSDLLCDYEEKIDDLQQEVEKYQQQMAAQEKKLHQQQKLSESFDQEREELFERIDEYERRISDYERERNNHESRLHEVESERQNVEKELDAASIKIELYETDLKQVKKEKENLDAHYKTIIDDYENRLKAAEYDYNEEISKLKAELGREEGKDLPESDTGRGSFEELQAKLDFLQDELCNKNEMLTEKAELVQQLEARMLEMTASYEKHEYEMKKLIAYESEITNLKEKLEQRQVTDMSLGQPLIKQLTTDLSEQIKKIISGMKPRNYDDMCIKEALLKAHEEVVKIWNDKQNDGHQNAADDAPENGAEKHTNKLDISLVTMATQNSSDAYQYPDEEPITEDGDDDNSGNKDKSVMSAELDEVAEMVANTIIQKAVASLMSDTRRDNADGSNDQENKNKEMDLLDVTYSESFEASSEARTISDEEIEADQSGGSEEYELPYDANGLDFSGDLTDSTHDGPKAEGHSDQVIPLICVSDEQEVLSAQPDHLTVEQQERTTSAHVNGDVNKSDNLQNVSDESAEARNNPAEELEDIESTIKTQLLNGNIMKMKQLACQLEQSHTDELSEMRLSSNQSECEENVQEKIKQLTASYELQLEMLKQDKEKDATQLEQLHEKINSYDEHLQQLQKQREEREKQLHMYKQMVEDFEDQLKEQKLRYEDLLECRNREHESDGNLLNLLQSDLEKVTAERNSLTTTNECLLKLLSEAVKISLTTEDRINQHLVSLSEGGRRNGHSSPHINQSENDLACGVLLPNGGRDNGEQSSDGSAANTSLLSAYSDEGLDLSQKISESLFMGPNLDPDVDEVVTETCTRLQTTVERLLDINTDTRHQLISCQQTQRDLVNAMTSKCDQLEVTVLKCSELEERLKEEQEAKEYLASELNKAEGLLQGYQAEHTSMAETIENLEKKNHAMVGELERLHRHLTELEDTETDLSAREQEVARQKEALKQNIGQEEQADIVSLEPAVQSAELVPPPSSADRDVNQSGQALLQENSRLSEEKRELERQTSVKQEELLTQITELQEQLEDQQVAHERAVEVLQQENNDLHKQIESMEKQLKSNRHFLEEQTIERELEREENQRALERLQQSIKEKDKALMAEKRITQEIQEIEEQLHEKTDAYNQLLVTKEQLECDLQSSEVTNSDLRDMIRTLEIDLEARTKGENDAKKKVVQLEIELARIQEHGLDLSSEVKSENLKTAAELGKQIIDLESQLNTLKTSEQLAWQKKNEIEEELKNLKTLEDELTHDKQTLQEQVCEQLQQISSLRVQVDELKLYVYSSDEKQQSGAEMQQLQQQLEAEKDAVESKEHEVLSLTKQLDQFHEQLLDREEEVQQLSLQLDVSNKEKENLKADLENKILQLQDENRQLQRQLGRLQEQMGSTQMPVLTQNLLEEKNNEIDHLNEIIVQLKDELRQAQQTAGVSEDKNKEDKQKTLSQYEEEIAELKQALSEKPEISEIMAQLREKVTQVDNVKHQLTETQQHVAEIEECHLRILADISNRLQEKEETLIKLTEHCEYLKKAMQSVRNIQANVKEDNKCLKLLIEEKDKMIDALKVEKNRIDRDGLSDTQTQYETELEILNQQLQDKKRMIEKRSQELLLVNEELNQQNETVNQLQQQVEKLNKQIEQLEQRSMSSEFTGIKKNLENTVQSQDEVIRSLQNELNMAESNIKRLSSELESVKKELADADGEKIKMSLEHQSETNELKKALVRMEKEINSLSPSTDVKQKLQEQKLQLAEEHQRHINEIIKAAELDRISKMEEMEADFNQQLNQLQEKLITDKLSALSEQRERLEEKHRLEMDLTSENLLKDHADHLGSMSAKYRQEVQQLKTVMDVGEDESLAEWTKEVENEASSNGDIYLQNVTCTRLEEILKKVHEEGINVLSLSDVSFLRSLGRYHGDSLQAVDVEGALKAECESLRSTIKSLQQLFVGVQKTKEASKLASLLADFMTNPDIWIMSQPTPSQLESYDWRSELLHTVYNVFTQQNIDILTELHTNRLLHSEHQSAVQQLEDQVSKMDIELQRSLEMISKADRQSLLAEIKELHSQVALLKEGRTENNSSVTEQLRQLEQQHMKKERHLNRQIQLLEYKLQQEKVLVDDLKMSLENERSHSMELTSQLSREKLTNGELTTEITIRQNEVDKLRDTLEHEQERLVSASSVIEDERNKANNLTEALIKEQHNAECYIEELEKERLLSVQLKDTTGHVIQKLKNDLENEKKQHLKVSTQLNQQNVALAGVRRELDLEHQRVQSLETQMRLKISDLQTALDMERARCNELNSSLQRERQLVSQLRESLNEERGSLHEVEVRDRISLSELHSMLELEKSNVSHLESALDDERQKLSTLRLQSEQEKLQLKYELQHEKAETRQLRHTVESLQHQIQELTKELECFSEKLCRRQTSNRHLSSSLWLDSSNRQSDRQSEQTAASPSQANRHSAEEEKAKSLRLEEDLHQLQGHLADRELHFAEVKRQQIQQQEDNDLERMRNSLKSTSSRTDNTYHRSSVRYQDQVNTSRTDDQEFAASKQLEELCQRLQSVIRENQNNMTSSSYSSETKLQSRYNTDTIQQLLRDVLYEIRSLQIPSAPADGMAMTRERTAWLKEKAELKLHIRKLEETVNQLNKAVHQTESQLQQETEKHHKTSSDSHKQADIELQSLYSKYLRAESFRKALIYQKKYLLVLLGGYQDTEQATLDALAKIGAYPSPRFMKKPSKLHTPYKRFRSAVRVVIAIHRMKSIVNKWKRVARSTAPLTSNRRQENGDGYVPSGAGKSSFKKCKSQGRSLVSASTSSGTQAASYCRIPTNSSHLPAHYSHSSTSSEQHSMHTRPQTSFVQQLSIKPSHTSVSFGIQSASASTSTAYKSTNTHRKATSTDQPDRSCLRDSLETKFSDLQSHVDPHYRRQIRSAFDALPEPAPTPPPSLNGDTPQSTDADADEALNDYIQRLENLQARLGSVAPGTSLLSPYRT